MWIVVPGTAQTAVVVVAVYQARTSTSMTLLKYIICTYHTRVIRSQIPSHTTPATDCSRGVFLFYCPFPTNFRPKLFDHFKGIFQPNKLSF